MSQSIKHPIRRLRKNSPLPLYYQLKEIIKQQIEGKKFKPHDRLPSEIELSKVYDISRMTARRALVDLENEGFVYRESGRGTFVAEPKLRQGLLCLTSFTEDIKARGMVPGAKVREVKLVRDELVAQKLNVGKDATLVKIQRIRLADGLPLALETSYLIHQYCPDIEQNDFSDISLYKLLNEKYGIYLGKAEQYLEAKSAGPLEAQVLGIEEGKSVLLMERTTYLDDDTTPIEFVKSFYRSDRYRFYVELKGSS